MSLPDVDDNDPIEFEDVLFVKETEKAVRVVIENEEHWIPKSQIVSNTEPWEVGGESNLIIPKWLAVAKGLY